MKKDRNRPGKVRIDPVVLEGGRKVQIELDKKTGVFTAVYHHNLDGGDGSDHRVWEGKDLEILREEILAWARTEAALEYHPVIVVTGSTWDPGEDVFGHRFYRAMRAWRPDGKGFVWRRWLDYHPGSSHQIEDDDVAVHPPGVECGTPHEDEDTTPVILDYTPERWRALLDLVRMKESLEERLRAILEGGADSVDGFLSRVPKSGLLAFDEKALERKKPR